jgi:uncharacterized membrane protein YfcA
MFLTLAGIDHTIFWPGIIILGFFIGFLSGTFGIGGGFLLTPLLRYIFGIPFETAIGSSLCVVAISSISGAIVHYRKGNVSIKLAVSLICGSVPGVEAGIRLLTFLKTLSLHRAYNLTPHSFDLIMGIGFILLLIFSMTLIILDIFRISQRNAEPVQRDLKNYRITFFTHWYKVKHNTSSVHHDSLNLLFLIVFGFIVGLLSGLLGVGGGVIVTPVLVSVIALPSAIVIGTSLFQLAITGSVGALLHTLRGHTDLILVLLIASTSIAGSISGSRLVSKIRGIKIRALYAGFLLVSMIFIIIEMITQ